MTKTKVQKQLQAETDSKYLLKIVLYILLGMVWLRLSIPFSVLGIPIAALPIGLLIGLLLIRHDKFAIDRKIEYPLIIMATIISYFFVAGIVI